MDKARLILDTVCEALDVPVTEVLTESRKSHIIEAGYIATKIMFDNGIEPKEILRLIDRSRCNVYYRLSTTQNRIDFDKQFRHQYLTAKKQADEAIKLYDEANARTSGSII